jgi:hypothetical protein
MIFESDKPHDLRFIGKTSLFGGLINRRPQSSLEFTNPTVSNCYLVAGTGFEPVTFGL